MHKFVLFKEMCSSTVVCITYYYNRIIYLSAFLSTVYLQCGIHSEKVITSIKIQLK
jgi:hypothetical protein